eukprot:TRINITY_DN16303_c0_g2_i4.p1 TRINITY_DN16303_c0_g2~~TRINITY_DN16303_c0_g2_i4.p1  ORF type:complete len:385 (-),score=62.85 TRINITY_DN16303_c0_g2_i4:394-1548(-)
MCIRDRSTQSTGVFCSMEGDDRDAWMDDLPEPQEFDPPQSTTSGNSWLSVPAHRFTYKQLCRCACVCVEWRQVCDTSPVWYDLCRTNEVPIPPELSFSAKHMFARAVAPVFGLNMQLRRVLAQQPQFKHTKAYKVSILGAEECLGPVLASLISGVPLDTEEALDGFGRFVSTRLPLSCSGERVPVKLWWQLRSYESPEEAAAGSHVVLVAHRADSDVDFVVSDVEAVVSQLSKHKVRSGCPVLLAVLPPASTVEASEWLLLRSWQLRDIPGVHVVAVNQRNPGLFHEAIAGCAVLFSRSESAALSADTLLRCATKRLRSLENEELGGSCLSCGATTVMWLVVSMEVRGLGGAGDRTPARSACTSCAIAVCLGRIRQGSCVNIAS